jgi:lipopolysaccharide export system protein LptC
LKISRHRRLLIALIVIVVGVLIGVAWLMWPEPTPKNLTLKCVRSEVVDGKNKLLFRVEGAERYAIFIKSFLYLHGNAQPVFQGSTFSLYGYLETNRQFYADPPSYSHNNDQGWTMQANVCVVSKDKSLSKLCWVIRTTWSLRKRSPLSMFSIAKSLWKGPTIVISEQIITSEVITNCPVRQFPDSDF